LTLYHVTSPVHFLRVSLSAYMFFPSNLSLAQYHCTSQFPFPRMSAYLFIPTRFSLPQYLLLYLFLASP
jgi:hypothetical protein